MPSKHTILAAACRTYILVYWLSNSKEEPALQISDRVARLCVSYRGWTSQSPDIALAPIQQSGAAILLYLRIWKVWIDSMDAATWLLRIFASVQSPKSRLISILDLCDYKNIVWGVRCWQAIHSNTLNPLFKYLFVHIHDKAGLYTIQKCVCRLTIKPRRNWISSSQIANLSNLRSLHYATSYLLIEQCPNVDLQMLDRSFAMIEWSLVRLHINLSKLFPKKHCMICDLVFFESRLYIWTNNLVIKLSDSRCHRYTFNKFSIDRNCILRYVQTSCDAL